jgi:flagellar assembly protein FliH
MSSKQSWNGVERRANPAAKPFVFAPVADSNGKEFPATGAAPASSPDPAAYSKGIAEGQSQAMASYEKTLESLRAQVGETIQQFTKQRELYFQQVERDVVQLSLSIARKILHREVQMDPMLLAGIVHVALEGVDRGTHVRLRANPAEIPLWRNYFQNAPEGQTTPELIGDGSLANGHCLLETELGSTHISLETQLKEIEQGFLDVLEHRPRERS